MYKCDVCTPPYSCFTKQDFQRHHRSKGHLLTVTRNMKLTQAQQNLENQTHGQSHVCEEQQVTEAQQDMNIMRQEYIGQEQSAVEQDFKTMEVLENNTTILAQETVSSSYEGHKKAPEEYSPPTIHIPEESNTGYSNVEYQVQGQFQIYMDHTASQVPQVMTQMQQELIMNEQTVANPSSRKMVVMADHVTILAQEPDQSHSGTSEGKLAEYSPPTSPTLEESDAGYMYFEHPVQGKIQISIDQTSTQIPQVMTQMQQEQIGHVQEMAVSSTKLTPPNSPPLSNSSDDSSYVNRLNDQQKAPNKNEDILKKAIGLELSILSDPTEDLDAINFSEHEKDDLKNVGNLFDVNSVQMLC